MFKDDTCVSRFLPKFILITGHNDHEMYETEATENDTVKDNEISKTNDDTLIDNNFDIHQLDTNEETVNGIHLP